MGLTPLLVFALIVVGVAVGPVRWEPPNLWYTEFGTAGPNIGNGVTSLSAAAGGLYSGGFTDSLYHGSPSQMFVTKYDLSHHQVWSQGFGNLTQSVNQISRVIGVADGVYVAGSLNASGFVRKYDLQGNQIWSDRFASGYVSTVSDSSVGPAGVYALVEESTTAILLGYDFAGNVLWTKTIGNFSYSPDPGFLFASANGLYVSGLGPIGGDGYVQAYDYNGVLLWNHQFSCGCRPTGVSGDATGVYVAGQYANLQAFVAKYGWDGTEVWMREFRPQSTAVVELRLSADSSGAYMAFTTKNAGSYLTRYDNNGNNIWLFHIPLTPYAVSASSGIVYVGGDVDGKNAVLSEYGQSSSLIFFGLNPPFSFLTLGVLVAAATVSLFWFKKHRNTPAARSVTSQPQP